MLEALLVIGGLVGFALLVWWAQGEARKVQKTVDDIVAIETADKIKEKSREVSEVADSRRDPRLHDAPDVVPVETLPSWLRR